MHWSSTASGTTDVNKKITDAIASALDEAVDGSVTPDQNSTASSTVPGAAGDAPALLKANGIDATQFKADFKAAIEQVQQGGVDISNSSRIFLPARQLM